MENPEINSYMYSQLILTIVTRQLKGENSTWTAGHPIIQKDEVEPPSHT